MCEGSKDNGHIDKIAAIIFSTLRILLTLLSIRPFYFIAKSDSEEFYVKRMEIYFSRYRHIITIFSDAIN